MKEPRSEPETFSKTVGNSSLNEKLKAAFSSNINQSQIKSKRARKYFSYVYGNWRRHAVYQQIVGLFTGMDFDTVIYLSVKLRLLMKNVDFSNRQRLKVSEIDIDI